MGGIDDRSVNVLFCFGCGRLDTPRRLLEHATKKGRRAGVRRGHDAGRGGGPVFASVRKLRELAAQICTPRRIRVCQPRNPPRRNARRPTANCSGGRVRRCANPTSTTLPPGWTRRTASRRGTAPTAVRSRHRETALTRPGRCRLGATGAMTCQIGLPSLPTGLPGRRGRASSTRCSASSGSTATRPGRHLLRASHRRSAVHCRD
jgi:hypothetical protein